MPFFLGGHKISGTSHSFSLGVGVGIRVTVVYIIPFYFLDSIFSEYNGIPLVYKSLHKKAAFFGSNSGLCNVMRYITIIPMN